MLLNESKRGWLVAGGLPKAPPAHRQHGEVLTRPWIVDLMLDLAGYTEDKNLAQLRVVEPSSGRGVFLFRMVDRLLKSLDAEVPDFSALQEAITAVELQHHNVLLARYEMSRFLHARGFSARDASVLVRSWIQSGDFLLSDGPHGEIDLVIGNPPYIRTESLDADRSASYRRKYPTMVGRADIYVGFFEAGLRLLKEDGQLAFICADRWMRNQYGAQLRSLVGEAFSFDCNIQMHEVDAFEDSVDAYPAITLISRREQGGVVSVETTRQFSSEDSPHLLSFVKGHERRFRSDSFDAARLESWPAGKGAWPNGSPDQLELIERLQRDFRPLHDSATKTTVGIGIATGNDKVFIVRDPHLVESDRLLPMVERKQLAGPRVFWQSTYLVNPWDQHGNLVSLEEHPMLSRYFEQHADRLAQRHVAKKNPSSWFRTIDKLNSKVLGSEKLLIPDMAMQCSPSLGSKDLYPHHNLYWITSSVWDLEVLGGLLLAATTTLFVGAHCSRMRGGTLRFQAQHLRGIPVPEPNALDSATRDELAIAFREYDRRSATEIAIEVYGLHDFTELLMPRHA